MTRAIVPALLICLAAPAQAVAVAPPPETALHGYVLGRYAVTSDDLEQGARYFSAAQRQDPGDSALMRRSFELALAAGDEKRSVALANDLAAGGQGDPVVALVRLTAAIKARDWAAVDRLRPGLSEAGYAQVVGPIVAAWTSFARGQADAGLAQLDPAKFTGFAKGYIVEQRAHMLSAAGRWTDAAALYNALAQGSATGINWMRVGAADALQQGGQMQAAQALLASDPGDMPLAAARARFDKGQRIGALAPDAAAGIAWMDTRLAADLSRERPVPLALVFGRLGTFLAPGLDAAWLVTGDVLARSGRNDAALAAYDHVAPTAPMASAVAARRATTLQARGDEAAAGALLQAAVARAGARTDDWVRLGDWQRKAGDHKAAAASYDKAIALSSAAPPEQMWPLYFLRGGAREQAGDWAGAEPDLRRALALSPEEPIVLNYLGYSMIDRGLNLAEAQTLVERAAALRPDDGSILDSLGWAYYRTGQYDKAVPQLERAAAAEPGDPTVSEHLGDALWRVGRRIEARFRWRAVLDLEPDAKQKAAVLAKLDYGLDIALARAPAR